MQVKRAFSWPLFLLMASVTFLAILSELVPSGILLQLAQRLSVSELEAGVLIGWYAIASAVSGIPIIRWTMGVNRKHLLLTLLLGLALSNLMVGLTNNYLIVVGARLLGGICAGVLWPMIAAYGIRLVEADHKGKAVAIIMSGPTFGISLGLPLMTFLGNRLGERMEFFALSGLILLVALLCQIYLPPLQGEKTSSDNSLLSVLRNRGILVIILLTILAIAAHYGVYTYITKLVEAIDYRGGIELGQILFGIGSILSVIIAGKFVDKHIQKISLVIFFGGFLAFLGFLYGGHLALVSHLAFMAWGFGYGALNTVFQTAIANQVLPKALDLASSLQSSTFNFSIMLASSLGGLILANDGMGALLTVAASLLFLALLVAFLAKQTLAE